jgi:hypothetical protein
VISRANKHACENNISVGVQSTLCLFWFDLKDDSDKGDEEDSSKENVHRPNRSARLNVRVNIQRNILVTAWKEAFFSTR